MSIIELPLALRPQTYSDAEIEENLGFGYVIAILPERTVFTTIGFNWGRMEWRPTNPEVTVIDVKQFDITQSLNFHIWRTAIISLGLGLGLMDTLVVLADGSFEHEVVPYIPIHMGLAIPVGKTRLFRLRVVHSPYGGGGAASGNTRLMFGVGLSF